jgi:hypothetical protein
VEGLHNIEVPVAVIAVVFVGWQARCSFRCLSRVDLAVYLRECQYRPGPPASRTLGTVINGNAL